jgi:tetratricopeptide (TPR) repeat protein
MEHQNQIFEKVKLIYEFNQSSPLFARVASLEIAYGNILEAVKILEEGIVKFPRYASPHFILGLAYAYSADEESAKKEIEIGCILLGSREPFEYYSKRIAEIIEERNSLTEVKRPVFIEKESDDAQSEFFVNLEDKLDLLAEKLSKAKIIPKEVDAVEEVVTEYSGEKIVSETLANIYFTQKNYEEALASYKKLIMIKPERADVYSKKIAEIKSAMKKN